MPWTDMPPITGAAIFHENLFSWQQQWDYADRERDAISGGTIVSSRSPASNVIYYEGTLTDAVDNGDGTITFQDDAADDVDSPVPYTGVGWVDGASVKRWLVGGGQLFNGVTLPDFAPGQYKIAIFP